MVMITYGGCFVNLFDSTRNIFFAGRDIVFVLYVNKYSAVLFCFPVPDSAVVMPKSAGNFMTDIM